MLKKAVVLIFCLLVAPKVFATCWVTTNSDSSDETRQGLRGYITAITDSGLNATNCLAAPGTGYTMAIKFVTKNYCDRNAASCASLGISGIPEGSTNSHSTIRLGRYLSLGSREASVLIGNPDSLDTYGLPFVDATGVSGDIFRCGTSPHPYRLQNIIIQTHNLTRAQVYAASRTCLTFGRDVYICGGIINWSLTPGALNWCEQDLDGDGYSNPQDCNDHNVLIHPGVTDDCDGIDNNCNGRIDENPTRVFYRDGDGDEHGGSTMVYACAASPGVVTSNDDCDDTNDRIYPGAQDKCNDGIDQDCSGADAICGYDRDGDGYCDNLVDCTDPGILPGDCNDADATIHPDAPELCTTVGVDNDCDGDATEATDGAAWHPDGDLDTFGNPAVTVTSCSQPVGTVADSTDCVDTDPAINPAAAEICGDGIDQNCDGSDAATDSWYADSDADGFGDLTQLTLTCAGDPEPAGTVADSTDCDDTNPAINPAAPEICNDGIDNNCDGTADEGITWYHDADVDSFGAAADTTVACGAAPAGYVADDTDCNDADAAINPAANEICADGIDNNCDGLLDVGALQYADIDRDLHGDPNNTLATCSVVPNYVSDSSDCNDGDPTIYAGAHEICGDGIDQDCNGSDLPCAVTDPDHDGDGFCIDSNHDGLCGDGTIPGDCNDGNPRINPNATEICDGLDNNCDGVVDLADTDGDGYFSICRSDCNDANGTIHPNAAEICGDGIDQDCDGADDPCASGETDEDGDGYCEDLNNDHFCDDGTIPGDCDDTNPAIHPGAIEICGNGVDDNCNGDPDFGDPACRITPPLDCTDPSNSLNPACQVTPVPTGGFSANLRGGSMWSCSLHKEERAAPLGLLLILPLISIVYIRTRTLL